MTCLNESGGEESVGSAFRE